jgi:hypothetical protein
MEDDAKSVLAEWHDRARDREDAEGGGHEMHE